MADSFVQLAADSLGKKIDTRTEGTNSEHRQVMVIGDPATNANVANVTAAGAVQVDGSAVTQPISAVSLPTHAVTQSGTWTVQPGNTANTTAWKVDGSAVTQPAAPTAATTGGSTPYHLISAATTNANNVKASAGTVSTVVAMNTNAAARFLKFYDKASSPTVGTDVPVQTFVLPGNANGAGVAVPLSVPLGFANGISIAITAAITDADATAISANDCAINIGYK